MSIFNGWTKGLKAKLLGLAILPLVALAGISYYSLRQMDEVGEHLEEAYVTIIPTYDLLGSILSSRFGVSYHIYQALAYQPQEHEKRKVALEKARNLSAEMKESIDQYEATKFTEEETKNWNKFKENKEKYLSSLDSILHKLESNTDRDWIFAQIDGGEFHKMGITLRQAAQANIKLYDEYTKKDNAFQRALRAETKTVTWSLLFFAEFVTLLSIAYIAHRVVVSISKVSDNLNNSSQQLSTALEQMSAAGQTLSQTSTSSAASLEETVASIEELTAIVNQNSDNARSAAGLSSKSREIATQGETEIRKLMSAMNEISASSKKIEEITDVIDDIAFQTNLLALNASVEAARAGEHGKGFAVVADAVRTLAQRAGVAAKDISSLIKNSTAQVQSGGKIAEESTVALSKIVESIKKVSDINEEIATASNEQASGIKQISIAMNTLDHSTQENAASSEQIAATSSELSSQSQIMNESAQELRILIEGKAS